MTTHNCQQYLEKVKNVDQDLRGMAVSDLLSYLKSPEANLSNVDGGLYSESLVNSLSDPQSYVQNLAIECLGQLVGLVGTDTVLAIVIAICNSIKSKGKYSGNSALSMALRVVVSRAAEDVSNRSALANQATPIVQALDKSNSLPADVTVDIFVALSEILTHAGDHLAADADTVANVQTQLLGYISHESIPVRRRAIEALGKFVVSVPGGRSDQALDIIFRRYSTSSSDSDSGILLRVLVNITRQSPSRVAGLIPTIIDAELKTVDESESERRVASLIALETIVRHCPELAQGRRDEIYDSAITALKFDPNYNYGDEDEDEDGADDGMITGSDEDFGDDFDDDIYEDDQDDSWEIRLNGVKLLSALIKSSLYTPDNMVSHIGAALIGCFKEREDIVRAEILLAYATILDLLKAPVGVPSTVAMDVENNVPELLSQQAPRTVPALISAIKSYPKATETKQLAFAIFGRLVIIRNSILDAHLSTITPVLVSTLDAEDTAGALQSVSTSLVKTNLKLDVLEFLRVFLTRDNMSDAAADFVFVAKDGVAKSVSSKTFQVPATSFDVAASLVNLLRQSADNDARDISRFNGWIQEMAALSLSTANATDKTLRTRVCVFIGTLLRQFGDVVDASAVDQALQTLTTWKHGFTHNLVLINALVTAASQPTRLPRAKVLEVAPSALEQAVGLLGQNDPAINAGALEIIKLLSGYSSDVLSGISDRILQGVIDLMSRASVSPPSLALQVLAQVCPCVSKNNIQEVMPTLIKLTSAVVVYEHQSSSALGELFENLGRKFPDAVSYWNAELINNWRAAYAQFIKQRNSSGSEAIQAQFPSQNLANAAKSILALYTGYYQAKGLAWSNDFLSKNINLVPQSAGGASLACLALRTLGYAALRGMLARDEPLVKQLNDLSECKNEDVRSEAEIALGSHAGSNPDTLPALFANATSADSTGALSMFQAVKVAIEHVVGTKRDSSVASDMWAQVTQYVKSAEKPLPDAVAQILAVFAVSFPTTYIPQLAACIDAGGSSVNAKLTFITAFRTLLADKQLTPACEEQIGLVLPTVLANISDIDVNVRRLSLLAMYTIIQSKPALIEGIVSSIQPVLFAQTKIDTSLIRTVTMGPFTKKIDDGLEARKCAYQCVHVLVRKMPAAINTSDFIDCVLRGMDEEQEVRAVVQQIVSESVSSLTSAYAANLDTLLSVVAATLEKKPHPKAVKHELERFEDMIRSTVGILVSLEPASKMPGISASKYKDLVAKVASSTEGSMSVYYKEIVSTQDSASK